MYNYALSKDIIPLNSYKNLHPQLKYSYKLKEIEMKHKENQESNFTSPQKQCSSYNFSVIQKDISSGVFNPSSDKTNYNYENSDSKIIDQKCLKNRGKAVRKSNIPSNPQSICLSISSTSWKPKLTLSSQLNQTSSMIEKKNIKWKILSHEVSPAHKSK